jgi:hypothetical protein
VGPTRGKTATDREPASISEVPKLWVPLGVRQQETASLLLYQRFPSCGSHSGQDSKRPRACFYIRGSQAVGPSRGKTAGDRNPASISEVPKLWAPLGARQQETASLLLYQRFPSCGPHSGKIARDREPASISEVPKLWAPLGQDSRRPQACFYTRGSQTAGPTRLAMLVLWGGGSFYEIDTYF